MPLCNISVLLKNAIWIQSLLVIPLYHSLPLNLLQTTTHQLVPLGLIVVVPSCCLRRWVTNYTLTIHLCMWDQVLVVFEQHTWLFWSHHQIWLRHDPILKLTTQSLGLELCLLSLILLCSQETILLESYSQNVSTWNRILAQFIYRICTPIQVLICILDTIV